jgi:ribonucleoside-diphosphate reductase alpha chain
MEAWRRGLKTTYYLHVKPRHSAEQSTVKVNKAESSSGSGPRKTGFGFAKKQEASI